MNITFLNNKCTSVSLLLHSRLVTRVYFWKRFMGLKTSEIGGLWSSHSGGLLRLWDLKRKDLSVWRRSGFGAQFQNQKSVTECAVCYHRHRFWNCIFLWCLIDLPWYASHHELCCSEPHSRQCVQRHTNEQGFMTICVKLNLNIVKERKIPFFWCVCVYIYLWMHLNMLIQIYFEACLPLQSVYAVADLKRENSVKIAQMLPRFFFMNVLDRIRTCNFD